jgi:hypothetical protein
MDEKTVAQVWSTLATRYASPSHSHVTQLRRQLQTLRQGSKTCAEFTCMAKSISDQLAIANKAISYNDLISYIIGGLNSIYSLFVMAFSMITKDKSMTLEEFQTQLLGHEQLLEHQAATVEHSSFAMFSKRVQPK